MSTSEINITKFNPKFAYPEHPFASNQGGMDLKIPENFVMIVKDFVKKFARKLLSGSFNLAKLIPPAKTLHHESFLMLNAIGMAINAKYMKAAAQHKDPLERLKLIASGLIGNLYLSDASCIGRIPIPDFPGTYLEALLSDGTYFYCEAKSRNPPSNNLKIKGPDNIYEFEVDLAQNLYLPGMSPNQIEGGFVGERSIKFKDGTEYIYTSPFFKITNALSNHKNMHYINKNRCFIWDCTNNLVCEINFIQKDNSWSKSITSLFSWNKKKVELPLKEKNKFELKISNATADGRCNGNVIATGSGNQLSYVEIEGQVYWRIDDEVENWKYDSETINKDEGSSLNKPFLYALMEKNYKEVDRLLEQEDAKHEGNMSQMNKLPDKNEEFDQWGDEEFEKEARECEKDSG